MTDQPGDGGFSNPTMYNSIEEAVAGRRKQILRLRNGVTITVGEFEDMEPESRRAFLANMAATDPADIE